MSGTLIGVGVGPGDPELITVKARTLLRTADVIYVPVAVSSPGGEPGYAERVVAAHAPATTPVHRLEFALAPHERAGSWRRAAVAVAATVSQERTAVFATLGDPAVYSTFSHLARQVRRLVPEVTVSTVPGITAMQELAARAGVVLTEHDEPLTLLPVTGGLDRVRRALADDGGTVVLYKGGSQLPQLREALAEAGALDRAVFGAQLGHRGEQVGEAVPDGPAPYLSTVIVVPEREAS